MFPHIIWSYTPKQDGPGLLMAEKLDAKTIQIHTTALITLHVSRRNYQVVLRIIFTMGNFYFQSLTLGHKAVLEEYDYWKHIVKNWDEVIRKGTLKFN